jgi:hypothetical protein
MLMQKEADTAGAGAQRPAPTRIALDDRLAGVRRRREKEAADSAAYVNSMLASAPVEVRQQIARIESDVAELGSLIRARGPMREEEARQKLTRRQFDVAVMLGAVSFPSQRFLRRDPLLAIRLPGERALRLVAHWDRWMADVDGVSKLCTFVHV